MTRFLKSAKYSIEHAKRRTQEFINEADAFTQSCASHHTIRDPSTGELSHRITMEELPVNLSFMAFDAVNALRYSLDHLGYAVARAAGRSGEKAHFPFGHPVPKKRLREKSKDIPDDIFDLMVSFGPYKGGNKLLWALNSLCNSHKHEMLTPLSVHVDGAQMTKLLIKNAFEHSRYYLTTVQFSECEEVACRPAPDVLREFIAIVEKIHKEIMEAASVSGLAL